MRAATEGRPYTKLVCPDTPTPPVNEPSCRGTPQWVPINAEDFRDSLRLVDSRKP